MNILYIYIYMLYTHVLGFSIAGSTRKYQKYAPFLRTALGYSPIFCRAFWPPEEIPAARSLCLRRTTSKSSRTLETYECRLIAFCMLLKKGCERYGKDMKIVKCEQYHRQRSRSTVTVSVWQYVWQILANTQLLSQLLNLFGAMGYYLDTQPPASTPESFDCVRKLRTK